MPSFLCNYSAINRNTESEGGSIGRGEINSNNDNNDDDSEGGEEGREVGAGETEKKSKMVHKSPTPEEAKKIRINLLPNAILIMRVTTNQKKGVHFLFSTTYLSVWQCLKYT